MRVNCDTAQEYYIQQTIKDKLQGYNYAYPKSTATILLTLSIELQQLRDQLQLQNTVGKENKNAVKKIFLSVQKITQNTRKYIENILEFVILQLLSSMLKVKEIGKESVSLS